MSESKASLEKRVRNLEIQNAKYSRVIYKAMLEIAVDENDNLVDSSRLFDILAESGLRLQ